jgi:hypothetical protein
MNDNNDDNRCSGKAFWANGCSLGWTSILDTGNDHETARRFVESCVVDSISPGEVQLVDVWIKGILGSPVRSGFRFTIKGPVPGVIEKQEEFIGLERKQEIVMVDARLSDRHAAAKHAVAALEVDGWRAIIEDAMDPGCKAGYGPKVPDDTAQDGVIGEAYRVRFVRPCGGGS